MRKFIADISKYSSPEPSGQTKLNFSQNIIENIPFTQVEILYQCTYKQHTLQVWHIFAECSPGFAGDDCTDPCPYPRYGALCNDTCDCSSSSCHHVFGCNITTFSPTGRHTVSLKMKVDKSPFSLHKGYRYCQNNINWEILL